MVDKVKTPKRLEEILADRDLEPGYETDPMSITLPDGDSITISASQTSPVTVTSGITLGAFPNTIYTTGPATTSPWATFNPNTASTKIQLAGENADITVNDWSLVDAVKRIEERLGLYQPNPDLEREWSDLRALADQYRKLEQHIRDKQATFDRLKAMPAPEVD